MNVNCPYCHVSSVCESTAVPENDACKLFQSLSLHPLIKVVLSMTLIVAVQYLKSNRRSLSLTQKSYRCEVCNKVFTVFYPFV